MIEVVTELQIHLEDTGLNIWFGNLRFTSFVLIKKRTDEILEKAKN